METFLINLLLPDLITGLICFIGLVFVAIKIDKRLTKQFENEVEHE